MNRFLLAVCLLFITINILAIASPPVVYLKKKVAVGNDIVTLYDVLDKRSTIDLAGATSVKICYTPYIGGKIRLSASEIKKWLTFYLKSPFYLSPSPTSVEITRATTNIDEDKMEEEIRERVGAKDVELLWTSATSIEAMNYSYSLNSISKRSTDTILAVFKLLKGSHVRQITASFRISTPTAAIHSATNKKIEEIYDMVRTHILSNVLGEDEEVSIQLINKAVLKTQIPSNYSIGKCNYSYSFFSASAHVYLYEDGRFKRSLNFMFSIKRYARMIVAKKDIPFNKIIEDGDVELRKVEINSTTMREGIRDLSMVIGKMARQYIRKGEPIYRRYLMMPPLIKIGDNVLVYVKSEDMEISVIARALTSGGKGDVVKLKNLESGKIISAIVEDKGIAVVPVM